METAGSGRSVWQDERADRPERVRRNGAPPHVGPRDLWSLKELARRGESSPGGPGYDGAEGGYAGPTAGASRRWVPPPRRMGDLNRSQTVTCDPPT